MADNKIDYREMYPDRNWKSRTPEATPKPKRKKKLDRVVLKPMREKTSETPSRSYVETSGIKLKDRIRELVLEDETMTPQEIAKQISRSHGRNLNVVTISNIKAEFRATLRFLKDRGLLKNVTR